MLVFVIVILKRGIIWDFNFWCVKWYKVSVVFFLVLYLYFNLLNCLYLLNLLIKEIVFDMYFYFFSGYDLF